MWSSPLHLNRQIAAAIQSVLPEDKDHEASLQSKCRRCGSAIFLAMQGMAKFVTYNGSRLSSGIIILSLQGAFPVTAVFTKVIVAVCALDIIMTTHSLIEKNVSPLQSKASISVLGKCTAVAQTLVDLSSRIAGLFIVGLLTRQIRYSPVSAVTIAALWTIDALSLVVRAALFIQKSLRH